MEGHESILLVAVRQEGQRRKPTPIIKQASRPGTQDLHRMDSITDENHYKPRTSLYEPGPGVRVNVLSHRGSRARGGWGVGLVRMSCHEGP